jgi:hypothetical protein
MTIEQVRQLSTERDQLKNTIDEKEKENYELQSNHTPFAVFVVPVETISENHLFI